MNRLIEDGIVYSNDIVYILYGYNNLDYNYNGMIIPSTEELRKDFKKTTERIFPKVTIVSENEMDYSMFSALYDVRGNYPHCFAR